MAGSHKATHTFLEWCKRRKVDIAFVGECWINKEGNGTQSHPAFITRSEVKKGNRVVGYCKKKLRTEVKVILNEKSMVGVEVWGKKLMGIYADRKLAGERWTGWISGLEGSQAAVGDWNSHNTAWDERTETGSRGRDL